MNLNSSAISLTCRRFALWAAWVAGLCLFILVPSKSVDAREGAGRTVPLRAQIEEIVKLGPPAVLAIVNDSRSSPRAAIGAADVSSGRKAKTSNVWRIASVTKLMTAAIVMRLVQEGRINLEDRLSKFLHEKVDLGDRISIRQLMNHSSGIPDYLSVPGTPLNISAERLQANLVRQRSPDDLLRDAGRQPRRFKPGAMHEYSNTNYLLLGMIVETVTGKTFQAVVRDRIIVPLKLQKTGFPHRHGRVPYEHLRGYVPSDSNTGPFSDKRSLIDVTHHDYFLGADGGLFSTLEETSRMLEYVLRGPLLSRAVRKSMMSNLLPDHDGFYRYGLGVMAFELPCGFNVYGHEGSDLGIYTVALFDPAHERSFVLAANMSFDSKWGIQDRIDKLRNDVFCGPHAGCKQRHGH